MLCGRPTFAIFPTVNPAFVAADRFLQRRSGNNRRRVLPAFMWYVWRPRLPEQARRVRELLRRYNLRNGDHVLDALSHDLHHTSVALAATTVAVSSATLALALASGSSGIPCSS